MNPKIQTIVNLREAHGKYEHAFNTYISYRILTLSTDSHLEVCMAEIDPKFKREKVAKSYIWSLTEFDRLISESVVSCVVGYFQR